MHLPQSARSRVRPETSVRFLKAASSCLEDDLPVEDLPPDVCVSRAATATGVEEQHVDRSAPEEGPGHYDSASSVQQLQPSTSKKGRPGEVVPWDELPADDAFLTASGPCHLPRDRVFLVGTEKDGQRRYVMRTSLYMFGDAEHPMPAALVGRLSEAAYLDVMGTLSRIVREQRAKQERKRGGIRGLVRACTSITEIDGEAHQRWSAKLHAGPLAGAVADLNRRHAGAGLRLAVAKGEADPRMPGLRPLLNVIDLHVLSRA